MILHLANCQIILLVWRMNINIKSINMQHKTQSTPTSLCDQNCLFFDGHFKQNVLEIFSYRRFHFCFILVWHVCKNKVQTIVPFCVVFAQTIIRVSIKGKPCLEVSPWRSEKETYIYAENHCMLLRLRWLSQNVPNFMCIKLFIKKTFFIIEYNKCV